MTDSKVNKGTGKRLPKTHIKALFAVMKQHFELMDALEKNNEKQKKKIQRRYLNKMPTCLQQSNQ
jgi:hypothetical protein